MSDFETAASYVLENEGGFVDNPADLGAATNFGISTALLANYRGTGITLDDVKNLSLDEAKLIYKKYFWNKLNLDEFSQTIATALLDSAVNMGQGRAIFFAQVACADPIADGVLGIFTRQQLKSVNEQIFMHAFVSAVQDYYCDLVAKNQKQLTFLKGWIRRAFRLMTLIQTKGDTK